MKHFLFILGMFMAAGDLFAQQSPSFEQAISNVTKPKTEKLKNIQPKDLKVKQIPLFCKNQQRDPGEEGIDCGGPCPRSCGCQDTDRNNDPHLFGEVRINDQFIAADWCRPNDQNHVAQASCRGGNLAWSIDSCPGGETCFSGICRAPEPPRGDQGDFEKEIPVAPTPEDEELCVRADPANPPPNSRIWIFDGIPHISQCIDERTSHYIICGRNGRITVNRRPCREGAECRAGVCGRMDPPPHPEDRCEDSDGGINPARAGFIHGVIDGEPFVVNDFCWPSREGIYETECNLYLETQGVREIRCDDGFVCQAQEINCVNRHGRPYPCQSAACVPEEEPLPPPEQEDHCEDSDGGINPARAGFVFQVIEGRELTLQDRCWRSREGIFETRCLAFPGDAFSESIRCDDGFVCQAQEINCVNRHGRPYPCQSAACVPGEPPPQPEDRCEDSDGGLNLAQAGFIHGVWNGEPFVRSDSCWASREGIEEVNCQGYLMGFLEGASIRCDAGFVCREQEIECVNERGEPARCPSARCVPESCVDFDPDDNIALPGPTVDRNGEEHSDFCDENILHQVGCGPGGAIIETNQMACPNNTRCNPDRGVCE